MNRLYFQDLRISDSSFGNYFFYKTYLILTILAKESSGTWMIGLDVFFLFTTPKLLNSWTHEQLNINEHLLETLKIIFHVLFSAKYLILLQIFPLNIASEKFSWKKIFLGSQRTKGSSRVKYLILEKSLFLFYFSSV